MRTARPALVASGTSHQFAKAPVAGSVFSFCQDGASEVCAYSFAAGVTDPSNPKPRLVSVLAVTWSSPLAVCATSAPWLVRLPRPSYPYRVIRPVLMSHSTDEICCAETLEKVRQGGASKATTHSTNQSCWGKLAERMRVRLTAASAKASTMFGKQNRLRLCCKSLLARSTPRARLSLVVTYVSLHSRSNRPFSGSLLPRDPVYQF